MAVSNNAVARVMLAYLETHPAEVERLRPLLLACVVGSDPVTDQTTFPAHVTCATVARRADGRVLQVRQPGVRRWTLPWGHVAGTDGSLLAAALRELRVQIGIKEDAVIPGSAYPIDVDSYVTPDAEPCGGAARVHFQVRFMIIVPDACSGIGGAAVGTRWVAAEELPSGLHAKVRAHRPPVEASGPAEASG